MINSTIISLKQEVNVNNIVNVKPENNDFYISFEFSYQIAGVIRIST